MYDKLNWELVAERIREPLIYRGADKFLARPGRKQTTVTEDFSFIYTIYNKNWRNISAIYIHTQTHSYIKQD